MHIDGGRLLSTRAHVGSGLGTVGDICDHLQEVTDLAERRSVPVPKARLCCFAQKAATARPGADEDVHLALVKAIGAGW